MRNEENRIRVMTVSGFDGVCVSYELRDGNEYQVRRALMNTGCSNTQANMVVKSIKNNVYFNAALVNAPDAPDLIRSIFALTKNGVTFDVFYAEFLTKDMALAFVKTFAEKLNIDIEYKN